MKTITVIIAAYRAENFIRETLESVLSQRLPASYRLELIVGIDGCDTSLAAANTIRDERLRVICMDKNYGTYITFNTMMQFASGEFIARFDADDIMLQGYLSRQIEIFEQYEDVFLTWARSSYIDQSGLPLPGEYGNTPIVLPYWEIRCYCDGQFIIRRELWNALGGFKPWRCNSDTDFLHRMNFAGFREYGIMDVLYLRRIHPGSLTQNEETGYESATRKAIRETMLIEKNLLRTAEDCHIEPVTGKISGE